MGFPHLHGSFMIICHICRELRLAAQELDEERRWEMNLEGLEEGLCDEVVGVGRLWCNLYHWLHVSGIGDSFSKLYQFFMYMMMMIFRVNKCLQ